MSILVRRTGAFGDVVLTTPVIRRLRRENPDAEIAVQTAYPGVFARSPHRVATLPPGPPPYPWTEHGGVGRTIDLDLAYERRPTTHIVNAFMLNAFGDEGEPGDRGQELAYEKLDQWPAKPRVVVVHAAKAGWRNRTLPEATWVEAVNLLRAAGCFPIVVGTMRDALPKARCAAFHSEDALATAALIARAACFVGSDSGLLHVAGATDVPIVGVFTCALAETRLPWRNGTLGERCEAVVPPLDCVGCLARAPIPATAESCERGDIACVTAVTAEAIVSAALRLMDAG